MAGLEAASAESTPTAVHVADQQAVRASMWATVQGVTMHRYAIRDVSEASPY
jgi:hypothetical protein